MNDFTYILGNNTQITTSFSENLIWIAYESAGLSFMAHPEEMDMEYFEDDQQLVWTFQQGGACVMLKTTRQHAEQLAKRLNCPLEVMEATTPEAQDRIDKMVADDLAADLALYGDRVFVPEARKKKR